MGWLKKITKSSRFQSCICWVGAQYIRFVYKTSRWNVHNAHIPEDFWQNGKPFILAFWHGRLLLMPYSWPRNQPIHMLISAHRDGQLIAKTVGHFGIQTIEGSTSKGGATALRSMLKSLKAGQCVGITPDGPRGPRMHASAGIVTTAKMAGVPIIPCAFGTSKRKHARSWDRFLIAKPFSRGVFVWGEPIMVPKSAKADEMIHYQNKVADALNTITDQCDILTQHPPIPPADLPPNGDSQ